MTDAALAEDPRDALIQEQAQQIEGQAQQIAALEAMVADLRERLEAAERAASRNSGNSSVPPSVDDQPGRKPPRCSGVLQSARRRRSEGSSRAF